MKKHKYIIMNLLGGALLSVLLDGGGINIIDTPLRMLAILACLYVLLKTALLVGISRGIDKGIGQAANSNWRWPEPGQEPKEKIAKSIAASCIKGGIWGRKHEFNPGTRKAKWDTGCLNDTAADAYPIPAFLRKHKD